MTNFNSPLAPVVIGLFVVVFVFFVYILFLRKKKTILPNERPIKSKATTKREPKQTQSKSTSTLPSKSKSNNPQTYPEHRLMAKKLMANRKKKGFKEEDYINCIQFSRDMKYLAFVNRNRLLKIFLTHSIHEKVPKFFHINVPYDNVGAFTFTNLTSSVLLAALEKGKTVIPYRLNTDSHKFLPGPAFPTVHKNPIVSIQCSYNDTLLLTCGQDTTVVVWSSPKATPEYVPLFTHNSNQMKNNMALFSPRATFFAVAAFTGDIKIMELQTKKGDGAGVPCNIVKALDVKGHKSSVYCCDFTPDNAHIITCSKDGTLRITRIDVRYRDEEDAKLISSVTPPLISPNETLNIVKCSPNQSLVALSSTTTLFFYSFPDLSLVEKIDHCHNEIGITSLDWSSNSKTVATSFEDGSIIVWKSPL